MRPGARRAVIGVACAGALLIGGGTVGRARAQENEPPAIRHDPPACGRAEKRARLCAYVVDDTGIAQVRLSFRARGARAYHWTPMAFDGALYCAWLPAPLAGTRVAEYYVEAIDAQFEPSRTADHALAMSDDCAVALPEPPEAPAIVSTTLPGQPPAPEGFDPATVKTR
jgi:hypothetical protein